MSARDELRLALNRANDAARVLRDNLHAAMELTRREPVMLEDLTIIEALVTVSARADHAGFFAASMCKAMVLIGLLGGLASERGKEAMRAALDAANADCPCPEHTKMREAVERAVAAAREKVKAEKAEGGAKP